jgi:cytochrome c peroxidase
MKHRILRRRARAAVSWLLLWQLGLVAAPSAAAPDSNLPHLEAVRRAAPLERARLELGRQLFHESRLSGDGSRSCASCHAPAHAFADGDALSRGYNHVGHFRNTPSLVGLRLKSRLMWDGRYEAADLKKVVAEMLFSPVTMNGDPGIVVERVRQLPVLMAAWRRLHGASAAPTLEGIVQAIADYAVAHDGGDTPVDAALRGDISKLSPQAVDGMRLFNGKAACVRCHSGPALSDGRAHRLGVPENAQVLRDPERTTALLQHHANLGSPDPMAERGDTGRHAITRRASDRGRFATPSLRGVARTAPYMHNGVLPTLSSVVEFHDRGGGAGSELRPLGLDARERAALVAFLEALSPTAAAEGAPAPHDYGTAAGAGR